MESSEAGIFLSNLIFVSHVCDCLTRKTLG
nr:MAG TPA: hypothetical protein [Caudoviricetes sp.]